MGRRPPAAAAESAGPLPSRARIVTYGLVGAMLVAALAQLEFWPLSSFRLFSANRGPTQIRWDLVVVGTTGGNGGGAPETVVDLGRLPPGLTPADRIVPTLPAADPVRAAATVRPWLEASGHPPSSVAAVRVYSVVVKLGRHGRPPAVPVSRTLRAEFPP